MQSKSSYLGEKITKSFIQYFEKNNVEFILFNSGIDSGFDLLIPSGFGIIKGCTAIQFVIRNSHLSLRNYLKTLMIKNSTFIDNFVKSEYKIKNLIFVVSQNIRSNIMDPRNRTEKNRK